MSDGEHTLRYSYNERGKPLKIEIDQTKHLSVIYGADGETVASVESTPKSEDLAIIVKNLFQRLLDAIRPAGISLDL
jgi:hypothetical protein